VGDSVEDAIANVVLKFTISKTVKSGAQIMTTKITREDRATACSICYPGESALGVCEEHEQQACIRAAEKNISVDDALGEMYWEAVEN